MYREFSSHAPIIFGSGSISVLGEKVKALGCKKVMCVTEKGIEAAGIVEKATRSLEAAGIEFILYTGVVADPPDSIVDEGGKLAKENGVDGLIGIGGGSSMDTAKAISIVMENPGLARDYILSHPIFMDTKTPIILVPTSSGTGSEVTRVAIISIPEKNVKWSVFVNTTLAIVDPDLTVTLPKSETVNTGLDAFAHAAEAITGKNWNTFADLYAENAIRLISKHLQIAYDEPSNIEARSMMALAANWAGLAFKDPLTHVGHSVADALGGHFHTPHGLGCALALPESMKLVGPAVPERMKIIAEAMSLPLKGTESGEELGQMVADGIRKMMRSMNMPSMRALGYPREKVLSFVPDVVSNHLSSYSPVEITDDVALKLLTAVYDTYE